MTTSCWVVAEEGGVWWWVRDELLTATPNVQCRDPGIASPRSLLLGVRVQGHVGQDQVCG